MTHQTPITCLAERSERRGQWEAQPWLDLTSPKREALQLLLQVGGVDQALLYPTLV